MSANGIVCRMCAKIVYDARNIYDNDYDDIQYICKFKQLFSDIVFEEDGYNLPEQICSNCCTKLEDASNFKKQCISSMEYLKKCDRNVQESKPENCNFEHVEIKEEVDWNEKLIENNSENIECDTSTDFAIPRCSYTESEKVENCQELRNKFAEIQKDQKTCSKIQRKTKGKGEARKLHFSVLKLKNLYPQVHVPNLLHSVDLDPFVLLTPVVNHNLFHGYQSEKMSNDNKSVTIQASRKVTYHRTNVNSEVHEIEEKNAKVRVQNSEEFYTCFVCQKSFRSHSDLKTHVTVHLKHFDENDTVVRFSENIITGENIEIKEELTESNEEMISTEDQLIITQVLEMQTENTNALEDTEGGKNIIKPYSCNECHKKFISKSNLVRHMNIHRGIKPYSCDECHKTFISKSNLEQHMRVHSDVKPYSCNECHKKFSWKSGFQRHMNVHNGVKPYSCNKCQEKFGENSSLKRHLKRFHSGVYPIVATSARLIWRERQCETAYEECS